MMQKYLRTYDNTKWVVERFHEVEVPLGCYHGAITLRRVSDNGQDERKIYITWTVLDSVWADHKAQGHIKAIEHPFLCGCGTIHDSTERCGG
jgi:hypothetical protein